MTLPDGRLVVKIADLGVGREVSAQTNMLQTFYGTPLYASPELVDNRPYNEKTDVWSLGVVLYELAALYPPFTGQSLVALAKAIDHGKYDPLPPHYSGGLSRLVRVLLDKDHVKRPSVEVILKWLKDRPRKKRGGESRSSGSVKVDDAGGGKDSAGEGWGGGDDEAGAKRRDSGPDGAVQRGKESEYDAAEEKGSAGGGVDEHSQRSGLAPAVGDGERKAAQPRQAASSAAGPVRIRVRSKTRSQSLAKPPSVDATSEAAGASEQGRPPRAQPRAQRSGTQQRDQEVGSGVRDRARGPERSSERPPRDDRREGARGHHAPPPRRGQHGGAESGNGGGGRVSESGSDSSDVDACGPSDRRRGAAAGRRPSSASSFATAFSAPLTERERHKLENELRRRRIHQERLHQALAVFGAPPGDAPSGAGDVSSFHWSRGAGSAMAGASVASSARPRTSGPVSGRSAGSTASTVDQHRVQLRRVSQEISDIEALLSGRPSTAGPVPALRAGGQPRDGVGLATSPPAVSPRRHRNEHGASSEPQLWASGPPGGTDNARQGTGRTTGSGSGPASARDERLALRRRQRQQRLQYRHTRSGRSSASRSMAGQSLDSSPLRMSHREPSAVDGARSPRAEGADGGGHDGASARSHQHRHSAPRKELGRDDTPSPVRDSHRRPTQHSQANMSSASASSTSSRRFNLISGTWDTR